MTVLRLLSEEEFIDSVIDHLLGGPGRRRRSCAIMTLDINKIYCGDNLTLIKQLEYNSIRPYSNQPPYDNLRTYNRVYMGLPRGLGKELYSLQRRLVVSLYGLVETPCG